MHNLSHCINFNLRCSHSIAIMLCLHYLGPLAPHPAPCITSALHLLCPHRSPSEPTTGPRTWTFGWRKRLRRPWTGRTFEVWCWIASFRRRWAYSTMFISIFQKTTRWENTTSVKCLICGVILRWVFNMNTICVSTDILHCTDEFHYAGFNNYYTHVC